MDGTGNALANQIYGNSGANRLDGGAGIDFLSGGDGDDVYIVSDVGDRAVELRATGGHDRVESAVSFVLALLRWYFGGAPGAALSHRLIVLRDKLVSLAICLGNADKRPHHVFPLRSA